jgi:prophage antirepressor-like protein
MARIFGFGGSFMGRLLAGKRTLDENELPYFTGIMDLYESGRWQALARQLTQADMNQVRELYAPRFKRRCALAAHLGIEPSLWGKMLNGTDEISPLSSYRVLLRMELDGLSLGSQAAPPEPPKESEPVVYAAALEPQPDPEQPAALPIRFDISQLRTEFHNGLVWFNLTDVCRAIDHSDPSKAAILIEPDDRKKVRSVDTLGRDQELWFISEAGLYQFLLSSSVPKARPFRRWVTAEVLPKIRQSGSYGTPAPGPDASLGQFAQLIGLRMQQADADARAYTDHRFEQVQQQVQQLQASPAQTVEATLQAIQSLEAKKADLHDAVRAIVQKARTLDQGDPDVIYYREWQNVWRTVHRYAQPPVSKISGYTHPDQIEHALLGAGAVLARLGGAINHQLSIDLQAVAV